MNKIQFLIYDFLLRTLICFLKIFKPYLPYKLQNYLSERQYPHLIWKKVPQLNQRRIWFHASSGEIEYIKPILKIWKSEYPDDLLFITYFSTSAREMIQRVPEIDGWSPLPFDLPQQCFDFIKSLRPEILVLSRTDLWPTLLRTLNNKPKILIASTWSEGSKKTQSFGRIMSQWCLPLLNKVCVVNEEDKNWITQHFQNTPEIIVSGDPRFDQVQLRLHQKRQIPQNLTSWIGNKDHRTFIAGSTWDEDEKLLLLALFNLNHNSKNLINSSIIKVIIVPHENNHTHIEKLVTQLENFNLPYLLWSQCKDNELNNSIPILIFDEKGWLAELYQFADFAFIGGSFKKQVHSVMEALGCGIPVLVGPFYKNNREAIEFSKFSNHNINFVKVLQTNSKFISHEIEFYINLDDAILSELKFQIKKTFELRCGGSQTTFKEIIKCL